MFQKRKTKKHTQKKKRPNKQARKFSCQIKKKQRNRYYERSKFFNAFSTPERSPQHANSTFPRTRKLPCEKKKNTPTSPLQWLKHKHSIYSGKYGLHIEILELSEYIEPTFKEIIIKQNIIEQVDKFVQDIWKKCDIKLYGSSATGLDIYSSDLDLCIYNWTDKYKLRAMKPRLQQRMASNMLVKLGKKAKKNCLWMKNLEVRRFAMVPIINFMHRDHQVQVDIGLEGIGKNTNGFVRQSVELYGDAYIHLCRILKLLIRQLGMDKPFEGGLGSFRIYVMVTSLLEAEGEERGEEINVGELLIKFCEMYGIRQDCHPNWPSMDCILYAGAHPHEVELHFRGVTKLGIFVNVLEKIYHLLLTPLEDDPSFLSRIIHPFYRPTNVRMRYRNVFS